MSQEEKPPKQSRSETAVSLALQGEIIPDGAVTTQTVITVLTACGVSFKIMDNGKQLVLYNKDGVPEGLQLPPVVRRKLLHRIAIRYGLKIEWFYHPQMVCRGPETAQ